MKTKLLKRIRKRYHWYKNSMGIYVLMDNVTKTASTIDQESILTKFPNFKIEDINDESLFRFLKFKITENIFPQYITRVRYKQAKKVWEQKIK